MPRPQTHSSAAAKQAAYRQRTKWRKVVAAQETYAQLHVYTYGTLPVLLPHATDEQRAIQTAAKERDMLDALWMLQTLLSDFGYDDVYEYVLQYIVPPPSRKARL